MKLLTRLSSLVLLMLLLALEAQALTVAFTLKGPAVVWDRTQTLTGTVSSPRPGGTLYVNGASVPFTMTDTTFTVQVRLTNGVNAVVARVDSGGAFFSSDTLRLTLGYRARPEVYAWAAAAGMSVTLHATVLENPDTSSLSFRWTAAPSNPAAVTLAGAADSVASFTLPQGAPPGEYYFTSTVAPSRGDTARARTFVTLDAGGVRPFNILTDHARWIDSAVVYQVFPRIFVENGRLPNVTDKLAELARLGVTTVYLQPVFTTHDGGMGYDVMDYFNVRSDYGSLEDLRTLVRTAHGLGMRILLDFVPNHASIYHPYAQDAIANGPASHYYDFFQRSITTPPVLGTMYTKTVGKMSFVYYFTWSTMPNLNFANAELRRMIVEAGRYWIEQCDVDGYRADAVWAVNERAPDFMKEWRLALKRLKPDMLLLAEDRAASPLVFDQRFDAAYDWAPDPAWVSHWYWQTSYSPDYHQSKTIFNDAATPDRTRLLGNALTNAGNGYPRANRVLRFMQNNDQPGFLATHDLTQTKMAAALLFSLDGIPMMYNGEEIGNLVHPYDAFMLFQPGKSIRSLDTRGLFDFYAGLIALRKSHPALWSPDMSPIGVYPTNLGLYAFRRWAGAQNLFTVINSGYNPTTARLSIPVDSLTLAPGKTYFLTDLLTGESWSRPAETFMTMFIPMSAGTTRLLYLDTVVVTGISGRPLAEEVPAELRLEQNYPNPFNPLTTIGFELPARGPVRLAVYDLLGKEVAALVSGTLEPGRHTVEFNAGPLSSGVYFYRLEVGGGSFVRKMLVIK